MSAAEIVAVVAGLVGCVSGVGALLVGRSTERATDDPGRIPGRRRPPLPTPAQLMGYSRKDLEDHLVRVRHELGTRTEVAVVEDRWKATGGDR